MRRLHATATLICLCILAGCATRAPAVDLRSAVMRTLPLPESEGVRVIADQPYLEAGDADHAFDLYLPEAQPRPALVLVIHGGAPAASGLRKSPLMRSWGMQVAARAQAAAAVIAWDGDRRDVRQIDAAYATLRQRADALGIDAERVCVLTFSAGVAAVVPHALGGPAFAPRCIVGLYGDWTAATTALPPTDTGRRVPALLMVRAGADERIPDTSAPAFVDAARRAGLPVDVLRHPQGVHVFETRTPGARTRRILRGVLDFLRAHSAGGM